jgi:excisionase family DNA binding protein
MTTLIENSLVLTVEDVAGILRTSKQSVYLLIHRKLLPSFVIGKRSIRVHAFDLNAFIESQRVEPST